MMHPPDMIDGSRVIRWSVIDPRHHPTGNCRHIIRGKLQGPVAGLAICQYQGKDGYYLFGCDSNWDCLTDTWHDSLEDALSQAEFEYEDVSKTWNVV